MTKPVHLHKSKKHKNSNVLLLFVPAIIFVVVLATFLLSKGIYNYGHVATTTPPSILGEGSSLDNTGH